LRKLRGRERVYVFPCGLDGRLGGGATTPTIGDGEVFLVNRIAYDIQRLARPRELAPAGAFLPSGHQRTESDGFSVHRNPNRNPLRSRRSAPSASPAFPTASSSPLALTQLARVIGQQTTAPSSESYRLWTSADRTAALSFDLNSRQVNAYGVLAKDTRQLVVGCPTYAAFASG